MKIVGVVDKWHEQRSYGFITSKVPCEGGLAFTRYFLSPRNIKFLSKDVVVGVGAGVLFNVNPSRRPGDLGFATDIEVYEDEAQAAAANEKKVIADTGLTALAKESANAE